MIKEKPGILQMIRAPFFSSILSPLIAGTMLSVLISNTFSPAGFFLVLLMGLGLHSATNVYNDIYDTLQGTDKVNVHRNEFSGGSGVLLDHPELQGKMFLIARTSLIIAFFAAVGLTFVIDRTLWPHLWGLYFLSAWFSKYYSAAPIKLASRGLGEISVWIAFGPMAILVAAVSQNIGFHPVILAAMPLTGISTLSILLLGQMIDLPADQATGKWGVAARMGTGFAAKLYLLIQTALIMDIVVLTIFFTSGSWFILLALIPYIVIFPKTWLIVQENHSNPDILKVAAKMNVQIHLLFFILFCIGIGISIIL
ncbi:MAG: prenyltransferase [Calditrichaceae bacterium]